MPRGCWLRPRATNPGKAERAVHRSTSGGRRSCCSTSTARRRRGGHVAAPGRRRAGRGRVGAHPRGGAGAAAHVARLRGSRALTAQVTAHCASADSRQTILAAAALLLLYPDASSVVTDTMPACTSVWQPTLPGNPGPKALALRRRGQRGRDAGGAHGRRADRRRAAQGRSAGVDMPRWNAGTSPFLMIS